MKILLKLDSVHFTDEQNQLMYNEMIEIYWNLPFIPNTNDLFDFDNIVPEEKHPDFYNGMISWSVDFINWTKINGLQTMIFWLKGE